MNNFQIRKFDIYKNIVMLVSGKCCLRIQVLNASGNSRSDTLQHKVCGVDVLMRE